MDKKYILHAVIIPNESNENFIKDTINKYIHNANRTYYRLTKNKIRLRNIPKTKFIQNSFKSKKIDDVTLVYGILKPEYVSLYIK